MKKHQPLTPPPAPPKRPVQVVIHEHRFNLDQVRALNPKNGDVFLLPTEYDEETAGQFAEALHMATGGVRCLIVRGDVKLLDEAAMNAAGWYRK